MYRSVVLLLFPIKAQVTVQHLQVAGFYVLCGRLLCSVLAPRLLLFLSPSLSPLASRRRHKDGTVSPHSGSAERGSSPAPPTSCLCLCVLVLPHLNCLPSPSPSTSNKAPEPAPRRANIANRKLSQTTSPTVQPPLSPLAAWAARVLSPTTDGEQPVLTGAGGGSGGGWDGGLSGAVQVATMSPVIVRQLSAEESR